jgi:hypothetical protein
MNEIHKITAMFAVVTFFMSFTVVSANASASCDAGTVSTTTRPHATSGKVAPRDVVIYCNAEAPAPFRVVRNGPLSATASFSGCSTPPPQACNLQVELQELVKNEYGGQSWQDMAQKGGDWGKCKGTLKAEYTCISNAVDQQFRTYAILQVEYNGAYGNDFGESGEITSSCE